MKLATGLMAITSIGVVTLITAGALAQHGGHARHDARGHVTHLRARDLLTDEQRRVYHEARWGRP